MAGDWKPVPVEDPRAFPMEKTGSDALFDYFEATYCCEDTRLGYYFEISSGEECLVYAESGFHNPHTVNIDGERTEFLHFQFPYIHAQEVHQPPEWVRSAAFYQIFPERFWNGDPALSPEGQSPGERRLPAPTFWAAI